MKPHARSEADFTLLRWLAVLPSAIFAWFVVFLIGISEMGRIEEWLCPPEQWNSGSCMDPRVENLIIGWFIALSAVVVVITATVVAPSHKALVSWIACGIGGLVAACLGWATGLRYETVGAIAAGTVTALAITLFSIKRGPSLSPHSRPD